MSQPTQPKIIGTSADPTGGLQKPPSLDKGTYIESFEKHRFIRVTNLQVELGLP